MYYYYLFIYSFIYLFIYFGGGRLALSGGLCPPDPPASRLRALGIGRVGRAGGPSDVFCMLFVVIFRDCNKALLGTVIRRK